MTIGYACCLLISYQDTGAVIYTALLTDLLTVNNNQPIFPV